METEANHLLGSYITKEYELLRSVLSHLMYADLYSASQVCRTWKSAAEAIWPSRTEPYWLLWHTKCGVRMVAFPQKVFQEAVYSKPQIAIVFVSEYLYNKRIHCSDESFCPDRQSKYHRVWEYIERYLPSGCPLLCMKGYGIVGTSSDLTETVEIENSIAYSALFLPNVPGVRYKSFQITPLMLNKKSARKGLISDEIQTILEDLQSEGPISGLLLFCIDSKGGCFVYPIVDWLQSRQEEEIAVAGGFAGALVNNFESPSCKRLHYERGTVLGLAISGKSVIASSTIIDAETNTEEEVDKTMLELKERCPAESQYSIGLMFACVGRGVHFYNKPNVEASAFRKHFPNTPLLGYFGNGEIGIKCLRDLECTNGSDGPARASKRKRMDRPKYLHSYTTIIMHLAFMGSNH